ncbi:MAG: NAD(P)-dependent glycerol-3-phosphate dehydrogenase [Candidatus Accumulibacter sp.]|jgi:glycerol-3-phosphate dehydrogenase (NAD(P)+)|nr:NAD(P)-dependent glycerol-3-phosphate dehydrogenase [Accumulibacter sp.]
MRLTILAAGAWGTALAVALGSRHEVVLWARDAAAVRDMRETRENRRFLPGIALPASVRVDDDLAASANRADLLIAAAPLAGLRGVLRRLRETGAAAPLLWVCKGFEPGSGKLPHQVAAEELGEGIACGALTGPSFAEEVARGLPAAITLASRDGEFARRAAAGLHGGRLRIYANDDLIGAETGGAMKNVMAIAAGISDGLGFGHNARAALMTRGLAEITRLGVALGGQPGTFMGLAGMGDLLLTCAGDLSRNRRVGLALAAGKPLPRILAELGHVAEGVGAAREAAALARRLAIDMPITQAVDAILHRGESAADAVEKLLGRDPKTESI